MIEARDVRCTVLQQKLGRLYFSAGKEEDIWPGCRWVVYRDSTDTIQPLAEGEIAESYVGISISDSTSNLPTQLSSTVSAKVGAADSVNGPIMMAASVDRFLNLVSTRPYSVYFDDTSRLFSEYEVGSDLQEQTPIFFGCDGPSDLYVVAFPMGLDSPARSLFDSSLADIEALYSQSSLDPSLVILSSAAPHFVALIPNVSRPINRNALLTTALRYKIDTSRLSSVFEYGSAPQPSFLPNNFEYSAYTSDADKAKRLLKENKSAGNSVAIDTYSPTLQSTSRFISGTLTQAGYRTTTVGWNEPADLRLMILPFYTDSPWVALREVLTSIAKDTVARDKANQPVRLADRLLTDAMQTSDSTQRLRLLQRVDHILQEDVGAFPLFRPIIHVCAKEEIRGIKFDKDGRLDLRSIYRLKLPFDSTEAKQ